MDRRFTLVLLVSLYLAQGLPYGFFTQALPVLMRERGLSLTAISFTGVLFLPWALKFLWAPWVDNVGSRRSWILCLQAASVLGAAALAEVDLGKGFGVVFVALVVFNVLAATQDIATDGLVVRLLGTAERGLGNGIQVGAYRLGMILGGGALLWVFARHGSAAMFSSMSAILLATTVPAFFLVDPPTPSSPRPTQSAAAQNPAPGRAGNGWIARLRRPGMLPFIAVICTYKFGEASAASLVSPFMLDVGLGREAIALLQGTMGSVMGLAGAAAGGWVGLRFGRRTALIACGVAQSLGMLVYVAASMDPLQHGILVGASAIEHLCASMATVSLFGLMMDASDPDHAGTDYTVLASAIVVVTGIAGVIGGLVGDRCGYASAFAGSAAVSFLGCGVLVRAVDRGVGPARLRRSWPLARG